MPGETKELTSHPMTVEVTDCPTTLERQMELLAALDDGWYDESSHGYEPAELQWVSTLLRSAITAFELPTPYIYPTPEGRVRAEWSTSDSEVIVNVDPHGRSAEVIVANLKSGATGELSIAVTDSVAESTFGEFLANNLAGTN